MVGGQYGFAFRVAFDAARAQRDVARMLEVGRLAHARYPNARWIAIRYAEALWAGRDGAAAAAVVVGLQPALDPNEIAADLAPAFARQLADDRAAAVEAFDAYRDALDRQEYAGGLAVGLHRLGHDALAFELIQRVSSHGLEQVELALLGYRYASDAGEAERGLESLRARVPAGMESALPQIAFDQREYELMWDEMPSSFTADEVRWTWLLRAMAWAAEGGHDAARRAELEAALATGAGDRVVDSARLLLDLAPEEPILSRAMAQRDICETAFMFGLKRLAAGEVEEGERWLQVALGSGDYRIGEWRWARVWAGAIANVGGDRARILATRANLRPPRSSPPVPGEPWIR
jgi:hypothetical protein